MQNELRAPRAGTVSRVGGRRRARRSSSATCSWSSSDATRRPATGRRPEPRGRDAGSSAGGRRRAGRRSRPRPSGATASRPRPASRSGTSTPPADTAGLDEDRDLGRPGEPPFTRGVQPTMYRSRLWTMRQYAGFSTAEETNRRFRYLLEQGQTGLSVAFDLPTQMGYDSDAPEAEGEVGRVGVPISSLADMETLVDGHPARRGLDVDDDQRHGGDPRRAVRRGGGAAGRRARRRSPGTVQNDILKEYIARGTWIYPPGPSMRLVTDVFEFGDARAARSGTRSRSRGYHMREAGATAAQELAFTLADAIAYVEAALARGLAIDDFAPRLSFFFAAWSELFEEVAKFRAARRMWARIVQERFGSSNARSMACRFHVQTAGSSLTAQSVDNNVVRTTIQALSAILGGAQSLHTNSRDEALALPTEDERAAGPADPADPRLRGGRRRDPGPARRARTSWRPSPPSWRRRRRPTSTRSTRWAARSRALEAGFQQRSIQESAYRVQRAIDAGDQIVVGREPLPRRAGRRAPSIQRIDPGGGARARSTACGGCAPSATPAAWEAAMRRLEDAAARHGQPAPAADRRRQGLCHRRRDRGPPPRRVGRPPRADHGLTRGGGADGRASSRASARPGSRHPAGSTTSRSSCARSTRRCRSTATCSGCRSRRSWTSRTDRVRIAFLGVGESKVELVEPTDDTTGVARFLAKQGRGLPSRLLRGRRT